MMEPFSFNGTKLSNLLHIILGNNLQNSFINIILILNHCHSFLQKCLKISYFSIKGVGHWANRIKGEGIASEITRDSNFTLLSRRLKRCQFYATESNTISTQEHTESPSEVEPRLGRAGKTHKCCRQKEPVFSIA